MRRRRSSTRRNRRRPSSIAIAACDPDRRPDLRLLPGARARARRRQPRGPGRRQPGDRRASGSGKTTLVNLLLRFWDYDEGEIRLGGRELRDLRADDVRRRIGVVTQRVDLFDATIRDNLALADADVTDEQIEEACRIAQLHDVIAALPAATRRGSARTAYGSAAASGSGWRSRARSSGTRRSSSSTRRRPTSMRPPSGRSSTPCARSSPAGRRWSSRTARRWPSSRSGRSAWSAAASSVEPYQTSPGRHSQVSVPVSGIAPDGPVRRTMSHGSSSAVADTVPSVPRTKLRPAQRSQPRRS